MRTCLVQVHKMVDLSDQPDREAMWYMEVAEAYNLFYLPFSVASPPSWAPALWSLVAVAVVVDLKTFRNIFQSCRGTRVLACRLWLMPSFSFLVLKMCNIHGHVFGALWPSIGICGLERTGGARFSLDQTITFNPQEEWFTQTSPMKYLGSESNLWKMNLCMISSPTRL